MSHYKLEPPKNPEDLDAWRELIRNCYVQLEYRQMRNVNLELLKRFAPFQWKAYTQDLDALLKRLQMIRDQYKKSVDALNKKRKADQVCSSTQLCFLARLLILVTALLLHCVDIDCTTTAIIRSTVEWANTEKLWNCYCVPSSRQGMQTFAAGRHRTVSTDELSDLLHLCSFLISRFLLVPS